MSNKEEFDLDKEVEKLSRKSNINMRKSEYAFENQIRKLDKDIDKIVKEKIKDFDNNKQLTQDYLTIDYTESTINRYKEKLKKI
ncbi:hypothetical protein [Methanobrevibacter sp.]|uniref:hypothetical protein n=1 Tax=Methanobrevibacter sp. TaxID=66852 RepID=UPI0026DFB540|nr:hypothetical protein [Methanobrevibacter sp.]MDO5859712.1 hypothetical protein [Methanobrevibacter sp.]